jgi:hypothetical protein
VPKPVLYTVTASDGPPTIEEAAKQLGLKSEDIDRNFGVVPIDPARRLYSVQAFVQKAPDNSASGTDHKGPFSNPDIEPFGPVQNGKEK